MGVVTVFGTIQMFTFYLFSYPLLTHVRSKRYLMEFNDRMTRKEAASYIGVNPATMANWASSGKVQIPYYKAGLKKVIYFKNDLDSYLISTRRTQAM